MTNLLTVDSHQAISSVHVLAGTICGRCTHLPNGCPCSPPLNCKNLLARARTHFYYNWVGVGRDEVHKWITVFQLRKKTHWKFDIFTLHLAGEVGRCSKWQQSPRRRTSPRNSQGFCTTHHCQTMNKNRWLQMSEGPPCTHEALLSCTNKPWADLSTCIYIHIYIYSLIYL